MANRRILEFWDHSICHHISTNWPPDTFGFKDLLRRRIKAFDPEVTWDFLDTIVERDNELDWCRDCLTDYMTTVKRRRFGNGREEWAITIIAYHQLGDGRDPFH